MPPLGQSESDTKCPPEETQPYSSSQPNTKTTEPISEAFVSHSNVSTAQAGSSISEKDSPVKYSSTTPSYIQPDSNNTKPPLLPNISLEEPPMMQISLPWALPAAFRVVLHYIYTDRIEHHTDRQASQSNALLMMEVYRLAQRFMLHGLEHLCLQYVYCGISEGNVLQVSWLV